jgi:hypothetical protein
MQRDRFIRQLRKQAKARGLPFEIDKKLGKGAHYRVRVGDKVSTIKSGDLSPLYMEIVVKQLRLG